ncbi:Ribosomal RNA small subunit methyltransferase I [Gammaproteobacteria bacterium]
MIESWNNCGSLYVVATPIGNLGDMTTRSVEILRQVNCIAAEDTRHSAPLLHYFGITTPVVAYHGHNERTMTPVLVERMVAGESIALISDAGTPLLSDPGFQLVRAARERKLAVIPIPGVSAVVCALSVCGLPCDRFVFEGFLPAKEAARRTHLESLRSEERSLVFYESPYRLQETLADLATIFGGERRAVLAREMTKIHETFLCDTLAGLVTRVTSDPDQRRGESVLIVDGAPETEATTRREAQARQIFETLRKELSASRAVAIAAQITGTRKNLLYSMLIEANE